MDTNHTVANRGTREVCPFEHHHRSVPFRQFECFAGLPQSINQAHFDVFQQIEAGVLLYNHPSSVYPKEYQVLLYRILGIGYGQSNHGAPPLGLMVNPGSAMTLCLKRNSESEQ